jgi:hypothetical protein
MFPRAGLDDVDKKYLILQGLELHPPPPYPAPIQAQICGSFEFNVSALGYGSERGSYEHCSDVLGCFRSV